MSDKIFISYSRNDKDFVSRLVKNLDDQGVETWLDTRDIEAGEHWDTAVQTALVDCDYFLVVLSPTSIKSDNVLDEVAYVVGKKRVFPVLAIECEIPYRLGRIQYVDFRSSYDIGFGDLLTELNRAGLVAADSKLANTKETMEPQSIESSSLAVLKMPYEDWARYLPFYSLLYENNSPLEASEQGIVLRGDVYINGIRPEGKFSNSDIHLLITDIPIQDMLLIEDIYKKMASAGHGQLLLITPSLSKGALASLNSERFGVQTTALAIGPVGRHMYKVLTDLAVLTGAQLITGSVRGTLARQTNEGLLIIESSNSQTFSEIEFSDLGSWHAITGDGTRVALRAGSPKEMEFYRSRREQLGRDLETTTHQADQVLTMERLARLAGSAGETDSNVSNLDRNQVLTLDKAAVDNLPVFHSPSFDFSTSNNRQTITIGRGYDSPYYVTDPDTLSAELADCLIIIFAGHLDLPRMAIVLEKWGAVRPEGLVIIANSVDQSVAATLVTNKLRGTMYALLITLNPTRSNTLTMLQRAAAYLNTSLFDETSDLTSLTLNQLSRASRVTSREYETRITIDT